MTEPVIVTKKAIDVVPELHGIWCSIENGEPFVNAIANRRWMDDGRISFMLESFNFYSARPDEDMAVVELPPSKYTSMNKLISDDEKFRSSAPMSDAEFARMWTL